MVKHCEIDIMWKNMKHLPLMNQVIKTKISFLREYETGELRGSK